MRELEDVLFADLRRLANAVDPVPPAALPPASPYCRCIDADGLAIEGDYVTCARGVLWGPCEHPDCGGSCSIQGDCECACHAKGTL